MSNDLLIGKSPMSFYRKIRNSHNYEEAVLKALDCYDDEPYLLTMHQLSFGLLFLALPSLIEYVLAYAAEEAFLNFLILPFIVSIGLLTVFMVVFLIVKGRESWENYYLFFAPSWERQGILRIFSCLIFNIFLIALLIQWEIFFVGIEALRGKIAQVTEPSQGKALNQGTFVFKLLFLITFWDKRHDKLDYFEFNKDFLSEFKSELHNLILPVLITGCYYLFTVIFFRTKKTLVYSSITLILVAECFYFIYYPMGEEYSKPSFLAINSKYFEVIPLVILLCIIGWLMVDNHLIDLAKDKFYPYRLRKKNKFTQIVVTCSFIAIMIGFVGMIVLLLILMLSLEINSTLDRDFFQTICFFFSNCLLCAFIGGSFNFGVYYFSLLFKHIVYEKCDAHISLKKYYIRVKKGKWEY